MLTIPSFINVHAIQTTLMDYVNLWGLLAIFIATIIAIKHEFQMTQVFYLFLIFIFLHSIYVDYLGVTTSSRVFGILYVYYIDFAGLGVIVSFILLLYARGVKKLLLITVFTTILMGLIFTQTRNAWLSTGFTIFTLIVYLIFNSTRLFIPKIRSVTYFFVLVAFLSIFALFYSGSIGERLSNASQNS